MVAAKTLSVGSSSFLSSGSNEFQIFSELERCESEIDLKVEGNDLIASECIRKFLSQSMDEAQKKRVIETLLARKQYWSGAFQCKGRRPANADKMVCFNIVQGDKITPGHVVFTKEKNGSYKILDIVKSD